MKLILALGTLLFTMMPQPIFAFSEKLVSVEVFVRDTNGAPLANEPIRIALSFSADTANRECLTDSTGRCQWEVESGIYELYWERWLDALSRQAAAENGLSTFGITVGDIPITYHFVLHSDNRIYFDAAPDAAIPDPIIPTEAMIFQHGRVEGQAEGVRFSAEITPTLSADTTQITTLETSSNPTTMWRILLFILVGLLIGGTLHLWSQQRVGGKRHA